jgi:ATP-dependent DNA ligase
MKPFGLALDTAPMEARSAEALPTEPGKWQFEPKWDGFRCLVFKEGGAAEIRGKSGKPLGRFFPEVVALLSELPHERFVADGELVIEIDGRLSFDALQMRLHPAESRIRKLAAETPARLVLFDILMSPDGSDMTGAPLAERRRALEGFGKTAARRGRLLITPFTRATAEAERWLAGYSGTDGVVAKRLDGPYQSGERAMIKVKRLRTADCVVGGFRYESHSREVGSLLLGLYAADGRLDHVGFTSTIANSERHSLTQRLEALRAPPGFTGKAPGGPSRWSTERSAEWEPLKPELVVEVRFDHVTGDRFRHGTRLLRWRPDKPPSQCTMEQIAPPPAAIIRHDFTQPRAGAQRFLPPACLPAPRARGCRQKEPTVHGPDPRLQSPPGILPGAPRRR